MRLARAFMRCVLTGALVLSARAATADTITWDWTVFGPTNPSGDASTYGNSRSLTVGGIKVTATGWGYTHDSATYGTDSAFQDAGLGAYNGGLGVCGRQEDTISPPTPNGCSSPAHAVGNNAANPEDFVLFLFTDAVTNAPVTLDPRSVYISAFGDTDVSYWLGTVTGPVDLTGYRHTTSANIASLGFTNPRVDVEGNGTSGNVYIPAPDGIGGTLANAILFGAWVDRTDDYFKIKSITADTIGPPPPVPEPLTVALFALGTAGLARYRRRMAARS